MDFKSLMLFEEMITPKVITIVYWLGLIAVVIGGFASMFAMGSFSVSGFLYGLFVIVAGALGVRIWCELLIVLFKINENIHSLAEQNKGQG